MKEKIRQERLKTLVVVFLLFFFVGIFHICIYIMVCVLYRLTLSEHHFGKPWGNAGGSSQQAFKHQGRLDPRHPWHLPIFQRLSLCFLVCVAQAARKILPRRHERRQQAENKNSQNHNSLLVVSFSRQHLNWTSKGWSRRQQWWDGWISGNRSIKQP